LAAAESAPRVVAAEFEHRVVVWDLSTSTRVSSFDTILDFGGSRLVLSPDGSRCIAGAYHRHGIACYHADTGRLIWQRKDLKKLQYLTLSANGERAFCGLGTGPCAVLDIATGTDIERWRGVRRVLESQFQPWLLLDKPNRDLEVREFTGKTIARFPRETFGMLAAVFGPTTICLSESGGPVRVLDPLRQLELWRYTPAKGAHVLGVSYVEALASFVGVEWPFERGGPKRLLAWEQPHSPRVVADLGTVPEFAFNAAGRQLLLSDGRLIDTSNGALLNHLPFEPVEHGAGA